MILICGGMVRSGSVWMHQMLREMLVVTHSGNAPQAPLNHEDEFVDLNLATWAELYFYKLIKLHEYRESLAPYKDSTKVVMTYRDLRDTALSLMTFRQQTLDDIIGSKILLRIRDAEERWYQEYQGRLYPIPYEGLKRHAVVEVQAIAEWLGLSTDKETVERVVNKWSIAENKKRAKQNLPVTHLEYMAQRHIASGEVERWRKELVQEDARWIVDHVGEYWFEAHGYELE
jgi:hypothetical protein